MGLSNVISLWVIKFSQYESGRLQIMALNEPNVSKAVLSWAETWFCYSKHKLGSAIILIIVWWRLITLCWIDWTKGFHVFFLQRVQRCLLLFHNADNSSNHFCRSLSANLQHSDARSMQTLSNAFFSLMTNDRSLLATDTQEIVGETNPN